MKVYQWSISNSLRLIIIFNFAFIILHQKLSNLFIFYHKHVFLVRRQNNSNFILLLSFTEKPVVLWPKWNLNHQFLEKSWLPEKSFVLLRNIFLRSLGFVSIFCFITFSCITTYSWNLLSLLYSRIFTLLFFYSMFFSFILGIMKFSI